MADENQTETIAALALKADDNVPIVIEHFADGRTFVARRTDFVLEQVTALNKAEVFMPKVVASTVTLQKSQSLAAYINRFKNADTVLFADIASSSMTAVIDYHGQPPAGDVAGGTKPDPRLACHRAMLQLAFSEQWKVWTAKDGVLMSQLDFADFLEQNGVDLYDPQGADLLELIQDLHTYAKSTVKTRVRAGAISNLDFARDNEVTGSKDGTVPMPNQMQLRIPIYFGEPEVTVPALMRFQLNDGTIRLGYRLVRPETVRQIEFQRVVQDEVAGPTEVTTVYGAAPTK